MPGMLIDPHTFVPEAIAGFCDLHAGMIQSIAGGVLRSKTTRTDKVALVIGGGSGHYPAFAGYVGPGLADAAVVGNIFASPSARQVRDVARAADYGNGVVLAFGNYTGDVLNFELAADRLRSEGVEVEVVRVTDDIASAPAAARALRRGIAGDVLVFKVAGAAAERGLPLPEVAALARGANDLTRSMGVAFRGCTLPGQSQPLFTLVDGMMGIGMGIHGEPGIDDKPLCDADELAALLVDPLLAEAPPGATHRPVVVLNGLGATKHEELFYLWHHIRRRLTAAGIDPVAIDAGEFVTSFDMRGCSLTMGWYTGDLLDLWRNPVDTPAIRRGLLPPLVDRGPASIDPPPPPPAGSATPAERQRVETLARVLSDVAAELAVAEIELNRLDAIAGDGDHGRSMLAGARAARIAADDALQAAADLPIALAAAADAWCDASGGTSGAIWAAGLRGAVSALAVAGGDDLATVLTAALDAITRLAGAQPGDKTVVDALAGAIEGARAGGWYEAAVGASQAAEATKSMTPKKGRARPLAARSIGHADAGAASFALCATIAANIIDIGARHS